MLSVWEPAFFMLDSFKICGANTRMDHFSKTLDSKKRIDINLWFIDCIFQGAVGFFNEQKMFEALCYIKDFFKRRTVN